MGYNQHNICMITHCKVLNLVPGDTKKVGGNTQKTWKITLNKINLSPICQSSRAVIMVNKKSGSSSNGSHVPAASSCVAKPLKMFQIQGVFKVSEISLFGYKYFD